MKKKKSPFRRDEGGSAAKRVSSRLIMLVFYMSVIEGVLIVTTVFSFRRVNHMVLNHLHWSSVYTFADHHVPNNSLPIKMSEVLFFQIEYIHL
jgi:hypothetical protein